MAAGEDVRTCSTCRHWSQWLPRLGDCLRYANDRREAFLRDDYDPAAYPQKAAEETEPDETCDKYEVED